MTDIPETQVQNILPLRGNPTTGELFDAVEFQGYRITSRVGEGGMGRVYSALHLALKKSVAVKTAKLEKAGTRERFLREASVLAKISHENVISIQDAGEVDRIPFIVMPFVQGETLWEIHAKRTESLEWRRVLRWIKKAADGLNAIHDAGAVHRDVNPRNIMQTQTGHVLVMDLGLVKDMANAMSTQAVGTPGFVAPEQQFNPKLVDCRTDVYLLGLTACHLLGAKSPYKVSEINRTDIPPEVLGILKKATESEMAARHLTAEQLSNEIDTLMDGQVRLPASYPKYCDPPRSDATNFVWVTGHSAAGKREFLSWCISNPELLQSLGVEAPYSAALMDPTLESIEDQANVKKSVLINWQCMGFANVLKIGARVGKHQNIVIHIRSELSEHKERFKHHFPSDHFFETSMGVNIGIVEAYRPFVHMFVDVALISGRYYVLGITRRDDKNVCTLLHQTTPIDQVNSSELGKCIGEVFYGRPRPPSGYMVKVRNT